MPFDPLGALRVLQRHDVRFIIIGGVAGRLWGSPTMTNDLDVCYDRRADNLERLAAALVEIHARLRGVDEDVPFQFDGQPLATGQNFTLMTDMGPLDVLGLPSGIKSFTELAANATQFDLGQDLVVSVCDLDDLMRMKRAAGRPKDRIELEVLAAVRDEHNSPTN